MLETLIVLVAYQWFGEVVSHALWLPIPGPVLGMLFFFLTLMIRRGIPHFLGENVPKLMGWLGLLFVPAGVGVIQYLDLLERAFWPLTITLLVALFATHLATAGSLKLLLARHRLRRLRKWGEKA